MENILLYIFSILLSYTCHVLGYVSIFRLFVLQSQPKS